MNIISTQQIKSRWIYIFNNNIIPFFNNKNVLDIGCLDGYGTFLYYKNGAKEVTGIDIDKDYIKISKINYPKLFFKIMDAETIDYQNDFNSVDVISCLGLLYLLDDQKKFLEKICNESNAKTVIIETVDYNDREELKKYNNLKFLKIDILKNIFINNNWTISYEKSFWSKELDHSLNKSTPFAQRIILVFSRQNG